MLLPHERRMIARGRSNPSQPRRKSMKTTFYPASTTIGSRHCVGATRSHVLTQIMKQGLQVTALGVTIGLAGALAVNRLIASLLFGVQPTDTVTIALVVATITAVAVGASWIPAWRASRVDPNVVLRDE